jgi:hypothetical protein
MNYRITPIAIVLTLGLLSVFRTPADPSPSPPFTVHEWGTFTSIAASDGTAVEWIPLSGPQDLPCFVKRERFKIKGMIPGTVRMETPVLYFYAPQDLAVSVSIRFRRGVVTEWYPSAIVTPSDISVHSLRDPRFEGTISWPAARIAAGSPDDFRVEDNASHYYAARETDASPIESGGEREKFLFYRGVGGFDPPVSAIVSSDGRVTVAANSGDPLGDVILFGNHDGQMTYQVMAVGESRVTFAGLPLQAKTLPPLEELESILVSNGLYPKEARAMLETWRDAWFEEGTRLIYVAPRAAVDDILPLDITPAPTDIQRVFVGRIELVTPTIQARIRRALAAGDRAFFKKHSRFATAMVGQTLSGNSSGELERAHSLLQSIYAPWLRPPALCE